MNMKKTILISLLTVISLSMTAQEKLIRIDSEDIAWQKDNPQYLFFNKEMARLLMPQGAAFGVECIPSFSPEWSLSYDSVAHALIYNEAQKSIWYSTYNAMYKKKTKTKNGRKISQRKLRKHPQDYMAPTVKTFTLAIDAGVAQMMNAIWSNAIGLAERREDGMLDGTTWLYFIGEQRAKAHLGGNYNSYPIVVLANKLAEAVEAGNTSRCDSLIGAEFQHVETISSE